MLVAEGAMRPRSIGFETLGPCALGIMVEKPAAARKCRGERTIYSGQLISNERKIHAKCGDSALKRGIVGPEE